MIAEMIAMMVIAMTGETAVPPFTPYTVRRAGGPG